MESRHIEVLCGVLGGILGLTALGIDLFAPLESYCIGPGSANSSTSVTCGSANAVQMDRLPNLWLPITVLGGLSLSVVLFAVWHSRVRSLPALVLLWGCTALLCLLATKYTLIGVSVVVVPSAVLALAASIAGTVAAQQRVQAPG